MRGLGAAGCETAERAGFEVGARLAGAAATELLGDATGEPGAAASGWSTAAEATAVAAFGVGVAASADVGGEIGTVDLGLGVVVVPGASAGAAACAWVGCHGWPAPR